MSDVHSADERRAAITSEIQERTGIDEAMIERLVRRFYERVREDDLIGPVFAARIEDWEPHLQRMFAFWSSVALMTGRYHGQPMAKHLPLPIDAKYFDRWLALFAETAQEQCPPQAADHFITLAQRVGESLELGIASARESFCEKVSALLYSEQSNLDAAQRSPLTVTAIFKPFRRRYKLLHKWPLIKIGHFSRQLALDDRNNPIFARRLLTFGSTSHRKEACIRPSNGGYEVSDEPRISALKAIFPMATKCLKRAHDVAQAAEACAATGNYDGAFRILLDVEEDTCDATTLLNSASLIWRNREK